MYTLITRALSKPPKNRVIRGNWELGDKGLPYNDSLPFVHTKKNKREVFVGNKILTLIEKR